MSRSPFLHPSDPMSPIVPALERLVVRKAKVALAAELGIRNLELRAEAIIDPCADALALQLVAHLAANTVHRQVTQAEEVPVTWWDGFKLAWFPPWALRRWPAKLRTIECRVEFTHMCPHMPQIEADQQVHALWLAPPDMLRRAGRR